MKPGPRPAVVEERKTRCFGVVVAAGRGERFGGPKLFARAGGHPLLYYSLRAFEKCPQVESYAIVIRPEDRVEVERLVSRCRMRKALPPVPGGRTRTQSVAKGVAVLPRQGNVAVHDGARPLVTPAMLSAGFDACERTPVTYGLPVTDTIKRVRRGRVIETVPRDGLYMVQTPQFFPLARLRRALGAASAVATDDCALTERIGIRPIILPGSPTNIKVTTREDLDVVRKLL